MRPSSAETSLPACEKRRANSRTPVDMSTIKGANYCYAEFGGHDGMWNNYSAAITERDLNYAKKLGLNQIRCFITYGAYQANPEQYKKNLIHLVRAADERGIGVMPVVGYARTMTAEPYTGAEEWAKFLVDAIGKEPGLAFWDVCNEPDYPPTPDTVARRTAFAKQMAGVFRKHDGQTPVTIGFAYEATMEKFADDVDVLTFHNYLPTRSAVAEDLLKAQKFSQTVKKQVFEDETGCIARANPYDLAIEEHMKIGMGYYIWELMIVRQDQRGWGDVHGVFYPDGTIRDPSIVAAVMGIFRNHGDNILLENPDREGKLTKAIADAKEWLAKPDSNWKAGLDIAETSANLIESAQIAPLRELPTRQVELMRKAPQNRDALKTLLEKDIAIMQPYVVPNQRRQ